MRLKRLETYGFKSFADRMVFDFEDGITAIIGPNGCGKSNVVDSIKWVVGEQSAKALRGSEMADIIFNGCTTRRPMALAEVTLTLEGLGTARGLGQDEVAITRRLTRDGGSSYHLNGRPCRLRDIRELLMDTGIGTAAYSTIEQGRIGFILEASTRDRRALLEEAAGISRYKARRKVAMRKLERVHLDLERIGQLLGEVERNERSVRRQAQTALRYQELQATLRDLRMVFALEEYGRLEGELTRGRERTSELAERIAAETATIATLEAALSEGETRLLDLEGELRERERERAAAQGRRDLAASRAADARHRLVEIEQQQVEDRAALAEHDQRYRQLAHERAETEQTLADAADGGDARLADAYQGRRQELATLVGAIDEILGQVDLHKSRQVECLRELARIEAELGRLHSTSRALGERRARLEERARGHDAGLDDARAHEQAARDRVTELETTVAGHHARLDELITEREELAAEGSRLDAALNDLRHEEGRAEVRLRLLSEYEKKAEGLFRGVKDVLRAMDRLPGLCGLVADCFRVGKREELAIETALGGAAQHVITETQEAAKEAIEFLRRERRGRATFLPLDDVRGRERPEREHIRAEGVVGVGVDLIDFERRYRPVFDYLLGGLLVVEHLDHAIALRRARARCLLVTLDGEVINPGGAMTGGRNQGNEAGGLVSRKNEIHRLEEQLTAFAEQRQATASKRDAIKKRSFDASLAVEEQRRLIQATEHELGEAKSQLTKAERDRVHVEEFAASFGTELEEIAADQARLETDQGDLAGQQSWFQALADRLARDLAVEQERLRTRAGERDRLQEEINGLRVDLATTEERREALRNHLHHLDRSLRELEDGQAEREQRLTGHDQRRAELTATANQGDATVTAETAVIERLGAELTERDRERGALRNELEEQRQAARAAGGRLRALERDQQEVELKTGELTVRLEGLVERIAEDYEVDLGEAHGHWQRPADLDLPKIRHDLATTEKELARLGPVNLAAIDELAEVEARREFLARQHEDLATAAAKLSEIIDHINTTSRKLFSRTYKAVRSNFQDLFRKLYGGGKADLLLEVDEGEDILEAGVEIIAQPPGKQPKSITLLSGGEKALTAIALLFAVYLIKPSPFCLLDEVDAPLDESNTDVYCRMIKEFCQHSQFIVITHNKRTMQYADAIYGITQAERGISTKISVKLEEVSDDGELLTAGRGPYVEAD